MGLESTFTGIDDLNSDWPIGASDPKSEGDNHLRGIKAALKANVGGTASQTTLKAGGTVRGTLTASGMLWTVQQTVRGAAGQGTFAIDGSGNMTLQSGNGSGADLFNWASLDRAGTVRLQYRGSTVLQVNSGGAAVTGTLSASGVLSGQSLSLTQGIVLNGGIQGVTTPIISSDAVNKAYVDTKAVLYLSDGVSPRVNAEALGAMITGSVYPNTDSTGGNCGSSSYRWGAVYAVNGTIQTSDEREKRDIRKLYLDELAIGEQLARKIKAYRWRNGSDERLRYGIIAQEVDAILGKLPYSTSIINCEDGALLGADYSQLALLCIAGLEGRIAHLQGELAQAIGRADELQAQLEGVLARVRRLEGNGQ